MMNDFFLPAEWSKQKSIWLSWPHNLETWNSDVLPKVEEEFGVFVKELLEVVNINICVLDRKHQEHIETLLDICDTDIQNIDFHYIKTNDAWIRDYGPDFVMDKSCNVKKILNWGYNSWGGKYPPFDDDNLVPTRVSKKLLLEEISTHMILEGGSFEVNGIGDLITTKSCLLNPNRNPELSQSEIEGKLKKYLGVNNVIWLDNGISGDDTDGHIDDFVRFVNESTIVYASTENKKHDDYQVLKNVEKTLKGIILSNGERPTLIKIPLPQRLEYAGDILPCSYANFLITNDKVLVPIFECNEDIKALEILQNTFVDRKVIGIPSNNIIIGLGSLHCLSKHEFDESHYIKS